MAIPKAGEPGYQPKKVFGNPNKNYIDPGPEAAVSPDDSGRIAASPKSDFDPTPAAKKFEPREVLYEDTPIPDDDEIETDEDDEYGSYEANVEQWAEDTRAGNKGAIRDMARTWLNQFDGDVDSVYIHGEGMGWTGRSGHKVITVEDFVGDTLEEEGAVDFYDYMYSGSATVDTTESIRPRTDQVTQRWNLDENGKLTAQQGHHDSPMMGERYTFYPMSADDVEAYEYEGWAPEGVED